MPTDSDSVSIGTFPIIDAERLLEALDLEGIPCRAVADDTRLRQQASMHPTECGSGVTLEVFVHPEDAEDAEKLRDATFKIRA